MSGRFTIEPTPLEGAVVLRRQPRGDARGFLERLWCDAELGELTGNRPIRQINRTVTTGRGTVRGLHFQRTPHREIKLVHCLQGRIFDVAVDLRAESSGFGQWHAVELSGDEPATYVIPEGFAHGFQALSDTCEMLYFHTAAHAPEAEDGLHPEDPRLAIAWPLPIAQLSLADRARAFLDSEFVPL